MTYFTILRLQDDNFNVESCDAFLIQSFLETCIVGRC